MQMALDVEKRDRFERLSAYLDGEVTADEKREIEAMLATDPAMQRLHARLLKLRTSFRSLPVPPPEQPVEQTVQQVFARIERRPRRMLALGGMAIAALFVGALVSIMPRSEFVPSIAQSPEDQRTVPAQGLMVALDRPVIEIPKATVASPNQVPVAPESSIQ
ncbi:transcriptional regulator [Phormidium tenue FACHB-886]|nr:transcriptional regulator [Phormidium tenue FACHB-886]